MSKNKHLTLDDRIEIQECLAKGMTFKAIANRIGKNQTTVSREVKAHAQSHSNGYTRTEEYCAVKFKPRKTTAPEHIPACAKKGRTYQDFIGFMEDNDALPLAQLDTVIGRVGGKTIMTVHFVNCDFMIALLLENKTAAEAAQKIQGLKKKLKDNNFSFGDIIPVLLTDNGGEFSIVSAFEDDEFGNRETNLFFCEPSSPNEKPEIEKNHTLFRDIVPAGHSFDAFTQQDVNLIFSHINAVKRKQFGGKSAYDLFTFFNSVELAQILGISYISPNDVIQSPLLLKKL